MRPPPNVWPNTPTSASIMFFAQIFNEMLTPVTFESFRVYSLDTNARLREALELAYDVRQGRVPKAALLPILDELQWSFAKDIICKKLADEEIASLEKSIRDRNNFSVDALIFHLVLLIKIISANYKETIEDSIIVALEKQNNRIEQRKLAGFYCSHLINIGYTRPYIRQVLFSIFFSRTIIRIGKSSVRRFLREFDGRTRQFNVTAAVSEDLGTYLGRHGHKIVPFGSQTAQVIGALSVNSNISLTPQTIEVPLEHLDPYGAMDKCHQMLSSHRAVAYLDPHGMDVEWGNTMHAARPRAQNGTVATKQDFLTSKKSNTRIGSLLRPHSISRYTKRIMKSFDAPSVERLFSSIRTAALARSSSSPENQLISIWSAVEVLLSEPRDQARILHYTSLITPCITLRHVRRQVIAVYDELLIGHKSRFRRVIRSIPTYRSSLGHDALAAILFVPEHSRQRSDLLKILSNNPLALHRVYKLYEDYKDPKTALRAIDDHRLRVEWQVHRVYRARNQLVHAGRLPSYLESLILNISEYYRSAVATIVNQARREDNDSDIDQVVAEVGIRYGVFRERLSRAGQSPITTDYVALLMDTPR